MAKRSMRSRISTSLLAWSGALGLMAGAQPAQAGEPLHPTPGVTAAYGWTGCYLGANAGWIGGAERIVTRPGPGQSIGPPSGLPPGDAALLTHSYSSQEAAGFTGGGQIGCNWQRAGSAFVFGVEADLNGAGLSESRLAAYPGLLLPDTAINVPAHSETVTKSLDWYSTLRGRAGLSWDRWLGYVTAGLAVGHLESSFEASLGPFAGSDSRTRYGWVAGGGLEYALGKNWSAKVEYLYLDFGTYSYTVPHTVVDNRFSSVDVDAQEHVVRAGLNYRF